MILSPQTATELSRQLLDAGKEGRSVDMVDLAAFDQIQEYSPEDLTITVQTGMTLGALQRHLRERGQWLPIDPPRPETTPLADVLHNNLSGPRRLGFGTIREHVLGLTAVLADGRLIHNGGKVVKNVAGYDLCKLLVGSRATLGLIIEATFKLLPLPEREIFLARRCPGLPQAMEEVEILWKMPISPVVLDLHNIGGLSLVVGLAGSEEEVSFQQGQLNPRGFQPVPNLDYQEALPPDQVHCHSLLPARLGEWLAQLSEVPFVARAGNGVVYAQGGPLPNPPVRPLGLERRVKELFDPRGVLPAPPW